MITENKIGVFVETNAGTLDIRSNELVGNDYGVNMCGYVGTENVEVHYNDILNNSEYGFWTSRRPR